MKHWAECGIVGRVEVGPEEEAALLRLAIAGRSWIQLPQSVPERLRHHQAVAPAIDDAYSKAAERHAQDVGAVSRRVHQTLMRYCHGGRQRKVLTGGKVSQPDLVHASNGSCPCGEMWGK